MVDGAGPVELVYRHGTEVVSLVLILGAMVIAALGLAGAFDSTKKRK